MIKVMGLEVEGDEAVVVTWIDAAENTRSFATRHQMRIARSADEGDTTQRAHRSFYDYALDAVGDLLKISLQLQEDERDAAQERTFPEGVDDFEARDGPHEQRKIEAIRAGVLGNDPEQPHVYRPDSASLTAPCKCGRPKIHELHIEPAEGPG